MSPRRGPRGTHGFHQKILTNSYINIYIFEEISSNYEFCIRVGPGDIIEGQGSEFKNASLILQCLYFKN